jgi:outer membrane protein OmpA-like peptidoglycan-associated protein
MNPMNRLSKPAIALSLIFIAPLVACGETLPSKELLEARAEYQKAQSGPAGQVNPAQVHVAKETLDIAEKAFNDDPGAPETRDRAYLALRKAQLAEAQAGLMTAEADKLKAQKDLGQKTAAELATMKEKLSAEQQRGAMTAQQLQQERDRRLEAEKRAKDALDALAKASIPVKEEPRGMVITLSGQVLFPSGKSELMPGAYSQLDNVVTALKAAPDRSVMIEGHTDSQGARAYNMDLAQRRAETVRGYLVSKGIPAETVKASGIGPDRPVADNGTAEGRANNRRVEIIVSPPERK